MHSNKTFFNKKLLPEGITVGYVQPSESFLELTEKFVEALQERCRSEGLICHIHRQFNNECIVQVQTNLFRLTNDGYVAEWTRIQ